jgi:hypothetical protein
MLLARRTVRRGRAAAALSEQVNTLART